MRFPLSLLHPGVRHSGLAVTGSLVSFILPGINCPYAHPATMATETPVTQDLPDAATERGAAAALSRPGRVVPLLFQRQPELEQMSDPLQASWNRSAAAASRGHELAELIDFAQLNTLFKNFLEVVGLPLCILDLEGNVLASSDWQRVCMEFHRQHPQTLQRCRESDCILSQRMAKGEAYAIYRCQNGLTDCAAPIVIEGQHVANLFVGQFLLEPPDVDDFLAQQEALGFDREAYFKALAEVPIVAEARIPSILQLLTGFAHQIAQHSLAERRVQQAYADVERQVKERTEEVQRSHALLQKLVAQVPGMLYQFRLNADGSVCFPWASGRIFELLGVTAEEVRLRGEPVFERVHADDLERMLAAIQQSATGLTLWRDTWRMVLPQQGLCWREGHAIPERLDDGSTLWHGFITDITQRRQAEEVIQQLAFHDPLTHLPNRRLLEDRLEQLITQAGRTGRQLALLFLDLNGFKAVNDQHGHAIGDALLQQVVARLQACVRVSDTVARLGGDEFVILLPNLTSETPVEVDAIAAKICAGLEQPYDLPSGPCLLISASIGRALYPADGLNVRELLHGGDAAMYRHKQSYYARRNQLADPG